jgi:flagellar hook assembly protein FlgD
VLLDAQGRRVRTLLQGTHPAGERSLRWDGRDEGGHALCAGLYWLELKAGRERLIRRLSLVR